MAAKFESDSTEDFVTCSVCLLEFDSEIRKPKFLPCSHTLCLQCLLEIQTRDCLLVCPLCRKVSNHSGDVSELPNNPYALHILKLKKPTVLTSTVRDFAQVLTLKKELEEVSKESRCKLTLASIQRKKVKQHLKHLEEHLNKAKSNLILLQDHNEHEISQIEAQLSVNDDSEELLGSVDAKPGDTLVSLRSKMKENLKLSENRLKEANNLSNYLDELHQNEEEISVANSKGAFACSVIQFLMEKRNLSASSVDLNEPQLEEKLKKIEKTKVVHRPLPTVVNSPISTFVLGVKLYNESKGEIHIKVNPKFAPIFVKKLGEFCFNSPKLFSPTVSQAIPGIFVMLPMVNLDFKPFASDLPRNEKSAGFTSHNADVGMTMVASSAGKISGWSFLFPLNFFNSPESFRYVKSLAPAQLFGHVSSGMHLLVMITRSPKLKSEFSFTLEAR